MTTLSNSIQLANEVFATKRDRPLPYSTGGRLLSIPVGIATYGFAKATGQNVQTELDLRLGKRRGHIARQVANAALEQKRREKILKIPSARTGTDGIKMTTVVGKIKKKQMRKAKRAVAKRTKKAIVANIERATGKPYKWKSARVIQLGKRGRGRGRGGGGSRIRSYTAPAAHTYSYSGGYLHRPRQMRNGLCMLPITSTIYDTMSAYYPTAASTANYIGYGNSTFVDAAGTKPVWSEIIIAPISSFYFLPQIATFASMYTKFRCNNFELDFRPQYGYNHSGELFFISDPDFNVMYTRQVSYVSPYYYMESNIPAAQYLTVKSWVNVKTSLLYQRCKYQVRLDRRWKYNTMVQDESSETTSGSADRRWNLGYMNDEEIRSSCAGVSYTVGFNNDATVFGTNGQYRPLGDMFMSANFEFKGFGQPQSNSTNNLNDRDMNKFRMMLKRVQHSESKLSDDLKNLISHDKEELEMKALDEELEEIIVRRTTPQLQTPKVKSTSIKSDPGSNKKVFDSTRGYPGEGPLYLDQQALRQWHSVALLSDWKNRRVRNRLSDSLSKIMSRKGTLRISAYLVIDIKRILDSEVLGEVAMLDLNVLLKELSLYCKEEESTV